MECKDVYCKVAARKRLKDKGFTKVEADNIADKVFKIIKKVVEKNG